MVSDKWYLSFTIPIVWILWNNFIKYLAIFTFLKAKFCFAKLKVEKDTHAKIILSQAYGNYCPKFPAHLCRIMNIYRENIYSLWRKSGGSSQLSIGLGNFFFHLKLKNFFLLPTSLLHFYWGGNGVTYTLRGAEPPSSTACAGLTGSDWLTFRKVICHWRYVTSW